MHIFLTGGSGFVGSAVLTLLIRSHYEVTCLIPSGSEKKLPVYPSDRVHICSGDLLNPLEWESDLADCDSIIHVPETLQEKVSRASSYDESPLKTTQNLVQAALASGIKRFLMMSAHGADPYSTIPYLQSMGEAEYILQNSDLDWTIFRPTLIFGPNDRFTHLIAKELTRNFWNVVPGSGQYELQPVGLQNVAEGFVYGLTNETSYQQIYDVVGPRSYSYNRLLDLVGIAIGKKRVRKLHLPLPLLHKTISLLNKYSFTHLTSEQLFMLISARTCDPKIFYQTFSINPLPFPEGIRLYLNKSK